MHAAPLGVAALEDVAPLLGRRFLPNVVPQRSLQTRCLQLMLGSVCAQEHTDACIASNSSWMQQGRATSTPFATRGSCERLPQQCSLWLG